MFRSKKNDIPSAIYNTELNTRCRLKGQRTIDKVTKNGFNVNNKMGRKIKKTKKNISGDSQ